MNYIPIIVVKAFAPLMLLSLAFAIAALVTAHICQTKKWIAILCGVTFLTLVAVQLALWSMRLHELLETTGMGKPQAMAEIVWSFLSVVIVTPVFALFALYGTVIAAFKRVWLRIFVIVTAWATLVTANALTTKVFDRKLSISLADGRWEREDQLWMIQRDAYVVTLKKGGVMVDPNEIDYDDLFLPREVNDDIHRDDFFEDHPPGSVLTALFTDTFDELSKANSKMLEHEILDKHRAACAGEGCRLAQERLERKHKD